MNRFRAYFFIVKEYRGNRFRIQECGFGFFPMKHTLSLHSYGSGRTFDRPKNLTGHVAHTGTFNIFALFTRSFERPGIKMYRFPWYLTLVSTNRASSNPGQASRFRTNETTKTQKCLTGWKCIRCHLTVITIQTILLQRLVLVTFLKDAFRAVNSTLSWSKG